MISAFPKLSEAQRALEGGRYVDAAQLALTHVRAHPQDARGFGLLGAAALRMGAYGQAEQFLRQSLALTPGHVPVLRELASCLQQQERLPEALELFEELYERCPDDAQASLMVCLMTDKLGRADEARRKFEALVERHPTAINAWLAFALNLRAGGHSDEAIQAYRRAIALDPER